MKNEILVIDDNADIRFLICNILKESGYIVRSAANYSQAIFEIKLKLPNLAIIDIKLDKGDKDGVDLLKSLMKIDKHIPVIMISGHANVQVAVETIRIGAYEFVEKPFSSEKLLNYVRRAFETTNLKTEKNNAEDNLFHSFEFIGNNSEILNISKLIKKLALTESRVLITGETGTGKELVARKIHKSSQRSENPFIVFNVALLKEDNYEKKLFGEEYKDGTIDYGILDKANNGTLLLDEVSEIPIKMQSHILRIITDQKFKRIEGSEDINVNIRIIASTSKDSNNDLLYSYSWPGNIRELRNLIERVTILSLDENKKDVNKILNDILKENPDSLKENILTDTLSYPLKEAREKFEVNYLISQIKKNNGNISKTADFIGMERSALHRKLKILGIKGIN